MATLFVDVMNFKFEVEKYDGKNNFRVWQVQVKDILIQRGLLKALKGKPSDMSDDDWEDFDLQARNTILLCLTKEITYSVMHEKSATMIWSKLESLYKTRCSTSRVYLQMLLYSLRMKEGTSIKDHVEEFIRIDSELLNIEVQLEDEFKASILLASLPDSYDHLVAPLLSNKETIHYDEVRAALLLFDNNSQGKELAINGRKKNRNPRKGRSRIN